MIKRSLSMKIKLSKQEYTPNHIKTLILNNKVNLNDKEISFPLS